MKDDKKKVPFDENGNIKCTDCCKDCQLFECPANETRCQ